MSPRQIEARAPAAEESEIALYDPPRVAECVITIQVTLAVCEVQHTAFHPESCRREPLAVPLGCTELEEAPPSRAQGRRVWRRLPECRIRIAIAPDLSSGRHRE